MKQNKAVIIGLTGPAGCGKSYICDIVEEVANALVVDTDTVAKNQMKKGGASYEGVVKAFGKEIVGEDGEIDRKKLAVIVFNDEEKLELLNSLTHPNVKEEYRRIIEKYGSRYEVILVESAILTRSGCDKDCDYVWYVYTPRAERAKRLKTTRGYSDAKIKSVMKSQDTDRFFRANSDAVIENRNGVPRETLKKSIARRLKLLVKS